MKYSRVARDVFGRPWAILQSRMEAIAEVIEMRMAGQRFDDAAIRERLDAAARDNGPRAGSQGGSVEVIPIYGVLSHRMNMFIEMSGGTSVQQLRGAFRRALADPDVKGIVFDVDSPGGSVEGIPELADEIRAARGRKPMVAVSNMLNASAAYFLAAQADEVIVSPSSLTGSIGVVAAHQDWSGANEQEGVRTTYVHAGKYKVEGNPDAPLDDEARGYLQGLVDDAYGMFVSAVVKGRGLSASVVRGEAFGEGRVLTPAAAVKAGMADRIGTLEDAFTRIAKGKVAMRAESQNAQFAISGTFAANTPYQVVMEDGRTTTWTTPVDRTDVTMGDLLGELADTSPTWPAGEPEPGLAALEPQPAQTLALAKARARGRQAAPTR